MLVGGHMLFILLGSLFILHTPPSPPTKPRPSPLPPLAALFTERSTGEMCAHRFMHTQANDAEVEVDAKLVHDAKRPEDC